jgi:hypothetical protein
LAKKDLQWIVELSSTQCIAPLWHLSPEDCDLEVQTDASKERFGVWFQGYLHQGRWDSILAFILPKSSRPCNILWRVDNTTALAYFKKKGGTISPQVLAEAEKALVLAHQMSVRILPVYIPTKENILADAESRFQEIPDWNLHPYVFKAITARWGFPVINLFASDASKQTKLFYSWNAFDNPEGVDALSQRWDFTLAYAFPPVALLKRLVNKDGNVERHLHPDLPPVGSPDVASVASDAEGLGGSPTSLPGRPSDRSDDRQVPILHNLCLVAWRICGGLTPSSTFQATPRISSRQGGTPTQRMDTKEASSATFVPPKFHSIKLV